MKQYKKTIAVVLLLCVTNAMSLFIGSHDIYWARDIHEDGSISISYPHYYNTLQALNAEREYCNAWMELCHYYLYDNNPVHPCDSIEKNNYWYDIVMESDYYLKIDSLNESNWEDWYCDWN